MIGALGNLGGFIAPTLKTAVETLFHSPRAGMFILAFAGVIGVLLLLSIGSHSRRVTEAPIGSPEATLR
jgi:nitrate/nitrite transporter NarK